MLKKLVFAAFLLYVVLALRLLVHAYADEKPPGAEGGNDEEDYGSHGLSESLKEVKDDADDVKGAEDTSGPPLAAKIDHGTAQKPPTEMLEPTFPKTTELTTSEMTEPTTPEMTEQTIPDLQPSDIIAAEKEIEREPELVRFPENATRGDASTELEKQMFMHTGTKFSDSNPIPPTHTDSHAFTVIYNAEGINPERSSAAEESTEKELDVFFWFVIAFLVIFVLIPLLIALACYVKGKLTKCKRPVFEDSDDEEDEEEEEKDHPGTVVIVKPAEMIV